jgi:hypothetical protein
MPRYQHDCSSCKFLGKYREFDLYFCKQISIPTVIARYSDDGPDYYSGIDIGLYHFKLRDGNPLGVAFAIAIAMGLINSDWNKVWVD